MLFERLHPVAASAGEAEFLTAVHSSAGLESGAERQRRHYRDTGNWQAVIEGMQTSWALEVERATEPEKNQIVEAAGIAGGVRP
jgi:hypothetical protein